MESIIPQETLENIDFEKLFVNLSLKNKEIHS
jgi:hypothetical protein